MIKNQYKRYLKSKFNLIIIICLIILTVINFYGTYLDQIDLQQQIANPSEDLNIEKAQELFSGYNGFTYLGNLLFSSDYYILTVLVLLIGFGAVIGDVTYKNLRSGYGNLLVLRCGYRPYIKRTLAAQCGYIITFVWGYFVAAGIVAMILFKVSSQVTMNIAASNGVLSVIVYLAGHLLILSLYLCVLFIICSLSTIIMGNKYMVQLVPIVLYAVPMLLASTLGNASNTMATLFSVLNSESFLFNIRHLLTAELTVWKILVGSFGLPAFFLAIAAILYRANCGKYEKGYI